MHQQPERTGADDVLDLQIRQFVDTITASYAQHLDGNPVSIPQLRAVAERVRAPWASGGPIMRSTRTFNAPCEPGNVCVRVHDPGPEGRKPALIYMHGGGWTVFSLDSHDRIMREYAARAGVIVVGVDYSLAPENKFPRPVDETCAVVRWLRTHGSSLGVDASCLVLGGDSAGANLALAACLKLRDAGELPGVEAMVLNYGAFDASFENDSHERFGGGDYLLSTAEMVQFWDNYLRTSADRFDPLACLLRARLEGLPPALLTIAEFDVLYDENIAMARKLRAAGVAVQANVYPGTVHSFLEAVSIAPVSDQAFSEAAMWLQAMMRGVANGC